ncbi:MAG: 50S ribosomal protein L11 methyltransferase [Acidobacteriota bacterium]|nr:50S ribosomal protein L11 methyltransferase [Acidobacteriota bacterium]
MSLIVDEHREYLSDEVRLAALNAAIESTVRPGDVVLDLGAGTGILGLMAARAGARHVYGLECGIIVGLACDVARANGFSDRITFIQELSTRAELPERVDVIVTDAMGRFGFEAGLLEYLPDARRRFLKPGGRTVPIGVDLWVAPVEHAAQWGRVTFWESRPAGFDFGAARPLAGGTGYPLRLEAADLLANGARIASLDLAADEPGTVQGRVEQTVLRAGTLHGIGGWFHAELAPSIGFTNAPAAECRINRRNVFFPVERPVAVERGDRIEIALRIRPVELVVAWQVTVTGPDGVVKARCRQSTFQGMLVPASDVRRTDPASVPELSAAGRARRSVLELCDGRRALAEIETEVWRRHPDLFPSHAQAAVFVAEVLTRYAV